MTAPRINIRKNVKVVKQEPVSSQRHLQIKPYAVQCEQGSTTKAFYEFQSIDAVNSLDGDFFYATPCIARLPFTLKPLKNQPYVI